MNKAVFLDRDGTINVEKEYLYKIEDLEFIPGTFEAIKNLNEHGYIVVVVTNQAGVARGLYDEKDVEKLHDEMNSRLGEKGAHIDAFYYCTHHPEHGIGAYKKNCVCRKPSPGLIFDAAKDLQIDLKESFMIGDKAIDIEAGKAAGCKTILVKTGYGAKEKEKISAPTYVYSDLLQGVNKILSLL